MKKKKIKSKPRSRAVRLIRPKSSGRLAIQPLADRVLVRPYTEDELKKKTSFGIILPESVSKEKSAQGKVLAVGSGRFVDGKRLPIQVKVGDTILFSKYSYDEVEWNGEDLYMIREENIFGIIGNS